MTGCIRGIVVVLSLAATGTIASAQNSVDLTPANAEAVQPVEPAGPVEALEPSTSDWRVRQRTPLSVGRDYVLPAGGEVWEVGIAFGTATIRGHVQRDVLAVLGDVRIESSARIDGALLVFGGAAVVEPGAVIGDDLVVVGGTLDAPPSFAPGGEIFAIAPRGLHRQLQAIQPWALYGLLWGRPIVATIGWVWSVVGLFFLAYLVLALVFDRAVHACAVALTVRPLSAFVTGLLVLLLVGPLCLLLGVSVIGLAVVPFVLIAVLVAWTFGKVGFMRRIGMNILVGGDASRGRAILAFVIGFGVLTVVYMIPILGLLAWSMVGVFGLGSATLAFLAGYRRENPRPVPAVLPIPAPVSPALPEPASPEGVESMGQTKTPESVMVDLHQPHPSSHADDGLSMDLIACPRATFLDRAAAGALDIVLVIIVVQLIDPFLDNGRQFLFMLLAYHVGFWAWKGTTVGGIICQLRVVRLDGTPLGFGEALVRGLSAIFSVAVLGLGFLWILKDSERQAWHDKIAGTHVVKVPRHALI